MRGLMVVLFIVGCGGTDMPAIPTCKNVEQELKASVPYPWAEVDVSETYKMNNGCLFIRTTHYVYETIDAGIAAPKQGDLPIAFYERGCGWDGCISFGPGGGTLINPLR